MSINRAFSLSISSLQKPSDSLSNKSNKSSGIVQDAEDIVSIESDNTEPKDGPIVRKDGISATYNLINFLNGMIGPGCFSVAMAFKQGGLWTAFFLVFFLGCVSTISMHKIVNASQYLSKILGDQSLDYGEMAEAGLAQSFMWLRPYKKVGKYFVNGCLLAFQIGVASVAYVFVVDHLQEIFAYFDVNTHLSKTELLLLYTIPATLINFVRDIRAITFVCLLGNIFIFASIGMILEELFTAKHDWQDLPWITDFDGVTMAAGSLLYSFEGQAMVLPLENKLRHPEDMGGWTGVLTTGMSLVSVVYTYCGFFGYITYGNAVDGSITLNLPDSTLNVIIKIMLVFVIFFGNVLQVYVIIEMLWPTIREAMQSRQIKDLTIRLSEYAFRACVVLVAMSLAIAVPNLDEIIPFIGITAGMLLSLIIPSTLDILIFLPSKLADGTSRLSLYWFIGQNAFLFLTGWFFLVSGLQSNIKSMINRS